MGLDYDSSRDALQNLLKWYELHVNDYNRNEATTRLQLIDRLLFECLGWEKEDCIVEESNENEYTDYSLSCPRRSLIIEAKKEGVYFELPAGHSKLEYSIKSLCRDNQQIKIAIEQAMNYCQNRGTPLGAVCNGHQFIIFIASRSDGKPPMKGKAIVFVSLQRMLDDFISLWDYISKPGVQEKKLLKYLLGENRLNLPTKLSASILSYHSTKLRNNIQNDLKTVAELVIEDVSIAREIETDFIKECFCSSGALSQYATISKSILRQRYDALFGSEFNGPILAPATTKKSLSITPEIFANSISSRPILLLGDVGVGKTIFIRYLINVAGVEIMENAISLYIDLGSKAALSSNLENFFLNEIEKQLLIDYKVDIKKRNFVRGVYNLDLERFSQGVNADLKKIDEKAYKIKEIEFLESKIKNLDDHLKNSLNHLSRGRKKQIILFLDNADQRDEEIQQKAFMIAHEIAANWPVTVFLSIRPETFHKSKKSGALSAYHSKAFTIAPPRVDEVLKKRLQFALKIAQGKLSLKKFQIFVSLDKLQNYLQVLLSSFEKNKDIIEFIDNICFGNIRLALEFITTFIGSGHVDTRKILEIEEKRGPNEHYLIPLHEFLRAIIYEDNIYYNSTSSHISNIFDITTPDGREHFLLAIVIEYINIATSLPNSDGFVEIKKIYEYAQNIGFTPNQIDSTLIRGLQKKLIEGSPRYMPNNNGTIPPSLRNTTVGVYHISKLIRNFVYLDAIIVDTPILDKDIRGKISDVHSIEDRLERANIFCDYLDKQWTFINENSVNFNWKHIVKHIRNNIRNISLRIS